MFIARSILFRLNESPRFLVEKNRHDEAIIVLRRIAKFNSNTMDIARPDVELSEEATCLTRSNGMGRGGDVVDGEVGGDVEAGFGNGNGNGVAVGALNGSGNGRYLSPSNNTTRTPSPTSSSTPTNNDPKLLGKRDRTSSSQRLITSQDIDQPRSSGSYSRDISPSIRPELGSLGVRPEGFENGQSQKGVGNGAGNDRGRLLDKEEEEELEEELSTLNQPEENGSDGFERKPQQSSSRWTLLGSFKSGEDRLKMLFNPRWRRTVVLMWAIWGLMSLAYGM